jgi:heme exporter protein C
MWSYFHRYLSPKYFYETSGKWLPWLISSCIFLFIYGLVFGLYVAPPDYQQGDAFRIIYVHVPSAFMSLFVYVEMAVVAAIGWIWRVKLADIIVRESAALGAWFTLLALVTGSIWGKPMWGTWWIWDARLTSELILLFLYCGYLALRAAIPQQDNAMQASSILLFVGIINIPIIHFSVYWWNTLHQGNTLSLFGPEKIAPSMLHPLLAMIVAFLLFYKIVLLLRARREILYRERKTQWVRELRW